MQRNSAEAQDLARQVNALRLDLQRTRQTVLDIVNDAVARATRVAYARQLTGEHIGREVEIGKHFVIPIEYVHHDGHTTWLREDYGVLSGTRVTLR